MGCLNEYTLFNGLLGQYVGCSP